MKKLMMSLSALSYLRNFGYIRYFIVLFQNPIRTTLSQIILHHLHSRSNLKMVLSTRLLQSSIPKRFVTICHDMARLEPMTSWYMGRALKHQAICCNTKDYSYLSFIIESRCIFQISLEHSRNFRSTPENTIKGGTRHFFEQNWFNASLKPLSHPCIFLSR